MKNGALLNAAEEAGFDLFITADRELSYQQNLTGRKMALVVLSTNNWAFVKAHIARVMVAVEAATPGSYTAWMRRDTRPASFQELEEDESHRCCASPPQGVPMGLKSMKNNDRNRAVTGRERK